MRSDRELAAVLKAAVRQQIRRDRLRHEQGSRDTSIFSAASMLMLIETIEDDAPAFEMAISIIRLALYDDLADQAEHEGNAEALRFMNRRIKELPSAPIL